MTPIKTGEISPSCFNFFGVFNFANHLRNIGRSCFFNNQNALSILYSLTLTFYVNAQTCTDGLTRARNYDGRADILESDCGHIIDYTSQTSEDFKYNRKSNIFIIRKAFRLQQVDKFVFNRASKKGEFCINAAFRSTLVSVFKTHSKTTLCTSDKQNGKRTNASLLNAGLKKNPLNCEIEPFTLI